MPKDVERHCELSNKSTGGPGSLGWNKQFLEEITRHRPTSLRRAECPTGDWTLGLMFLCANCHPGHGKAFHIVAPTPIPQGMCVQWGKGMQGGSHRREGRWLYCWGVGVAKREKLPASWCCGPQGRTEDRSSASPRIPQTTSYPESLGQLLPRWMGELWIYLKSRAHGPGPPVRNNVHQA